MGKILVVEDDVQLSTIICDELKIRHHLAEVVHDGKEALEKLQFYKYDLIILDWNLPSMSGVETGIKSSAMRFGPRPAPPVRKTFRRRRPRRTPRVR